MLTVIGKGLTNFIGKFLNDLRTRVECCLSNFVSHLGSFDVFYKGSLVVIEFFRDGKDRLFVGGIIFENMI